MEYRRLGRTGLQVAVLGFGGSEIGYEGASLRTVERLLGSALDAGLNLIDTAACYANSEELIGRAVGHRRKDFYLMTKCGHAGEEFGLPDWSPALVSKSIERSLKRLRTECLDIVQFHSCELEALKRGDLTRELARARERGLVRYLGYSGDGDAALWAVESGVFDTLQISINIADQEALEKILPRAIEQDVGVIAKRPIANAAWSVSWYSLDGYVRPYARRLRKLRYEFLKAPIGDAIATALRFTLGVPGVHCAIVGTKRPERWPQNAATAALGPLPSSQFDEVRDRWKKIAGGDWVGQR